jgi:hypothetical protein
MSRHVDNTGMKVRVLLLALVFLTSGFANAADEQYAVVRIPSHGASATVIETGQGYTWLLGCGHAYQGSDRVKEMVFDICSRTSAPPSRVGSHLEALDYAADLSLVLLNYGPVDYVAPVAPLRTNPSGHRILSVGFDEMRFPVTQKTATILFDYQGTWFTREKPWHGRSGGALLDMDLGRLIGVVQGYETPYRSPETRGLYIDLITIHHFIDSYRARKGTQQWTPSPKPQSRQLPPCPT